MVRAAADERPALVSSGHPYCAPRAGGDRPGVLPTDDTDRDERRETVNEGSRVPTTKKLGVPLDSTGPGR